eukprot:TRINITY_DN9680_c0_g2_i2.p1 TRINITY_DN9680_c0_g2~~TRINITY_DN9680_c0_g2_i2.p1  ORF type:complete len:473 (+),score=121.02 TRINITY_DN9680_c0_g2_i2:2175-3593(+)
MLVQGALRTLTETLREAALSVQFDLMDTISHLLFSNHEYQQEFRRMNGYSFFLRVFDRVIDVSSEDRKALVDHSFNLFFTIALDGNKTRLVGNLDVLVLLFQVLQYSSNLDVRIQSLRCIRDILAVNPNNVVAIKYIGGIHVLLSLLSRNGKSIPLPNDPYDVSMPKFKPRESQTSESSKQDTEHRQESTTTESQTETSDETQDQPPTDQTPTDQTPEENEFDTPIDTFESPQSSFFTLETKTNESTPAHSADPIDSIDDDASATLTDTERLLLVEINGLIEYCAILLSQSESQLLLEYADLLDTTNQWKFSKFDPANPNPNLPDIARTLHKTTPPYNKNVNAEVKLMVLSSMANIMADAAHRKAPISRSRDIVRFLVDQVDDWNHLVMSDSTPETPVVQRHSTNSPLTNELVTGGTSTSSSSSSSSSASTSSITTESTFDSFATTPEQRNQPIPHPPPPFFPILRPPSSFF